MKLNHIISDQEVIEALSMCGSEIGRVKLADLDTGHAQPYHLFDQK